jgi:tetratricopeptide (TPR) repeat protein
MEQLRRSWLKVIGVALWLTLLLLLVLGLLYPNTGWVLVVAILPGMFLLLHRYILVFRGAFLLQNQKFDAALSYSNRILKLRPNGIGPLVCRGFARAGLKDYQGALVDISRAIEQVKRSRTMAHKQQLENFENLYQARANLYQRTEQYDAMLRDAQSLKRVRPGSERAYIASAIAFLNLDNNEAAAEEIAQMSSLPLTTNGSLFRHQIEGILHHRAGEYDAAIADYKIALREHPNSAEVKSFTPILHYAQGTSFFAKEDYTNAFSYFQKANAAEPNELLMKSGWAIAKYHAGEHSEALQLWREASLEEARYNDVEWIKREYRWSPKMAAIALQIVAEIHL